MMIPKIHVLFFVAQIQIIILIMTPKICFLMENGLSAMSIIPRPYELEKETEFLLCLRDIVTVFSLWCLLLCSFPLDSTAPAELIRPFPNRCTRSFPIRAVFVVRETAAVQLSIASCVVLVTQTTM